MMELKYRSNTAQQVEQGYAGPALSQERERQVLGGQQYSSNTKFGELEKRLKASLDAIRDIGLEGKPELYKQLIFFLEQLGLTSPEKRIAKQGSMLEQHTYALKSGMEEYQQNLSQLGEVIRGQREFMRDAKAIVNKYEIMRDTLYEQVDTLETDAEKIKQQLQTEPKNGALIEAYENAQIERDNLREDTRLVEERLEQAASQVIIADDQIQGLNQTFVLSESAYFGFRDQYHCFERLSSRLTLFTRQGDRANLLRTLGILRNTSQIGDAASETLDSLTEHYSQVAGVVNEIPINGIDGKGTKPDKRIEELGEKNKQRKSRTLHLAKEIMARGTD